MLNELTFWKELGCRETALQQIKFKKIIVSRIPFEIPSGVPVGTSPEILPEFPLTCVDFSFFSLFLLDKHKTKKNERGWNCPFFRPSLPRVCLEKWERK